MSEQGIAAHWKYKEHGRIDEKDGKVFSWLRQFVEWNQDLAGQSPVYGFGQVGSVSRRGVRVYSARAW